MSIVETVVIHLLVDTCVWLDIALDPRLAPLLDIVERGLQQKVLAVVVPDQIVTELERNADSVQQRTKKAFEAMLRDAMDASKVLSSGAEQAELHRILAAVSNKLPSHQGVLNSRIGRIQKILTGKLILAQASTNEMMVSAFRRGLAKQAPFGRGKNSCGDALLLEHFDTYGRTLRTGEPFYFVTSNKADFSSAEDNRLPHEQIADLFNPSGRHFSINIAECLESLDTKAVTTAIVKAAEEAAERSMVACPAGGDHDFDSSRGANLRSRYGGLTWHIFCKKCGAKFDTGESYD